MRWLRWWRRSKITPPKEIELPKHEGQGNHSAEAARESERKLDDAIRTKKEVTQLLKVNDQFAEALQRSMRRSHG